MTVPYTKSPGSIPRFLNHVQTSGVPERVTVKYLKASGFTSSNDNYLVGLLKGIGLIDGSGVPTDSWREYRDRSKAPNVLAGAIRRGYAGLFAVYPDAFQRDDEAITNYIRANTDFAGDTVTRALRSFRQLCQLADFDAEAVHTPAEEMDSHPQATASPGPVATVVRQPSGPRAPQITINVELKLPAGADAETYDAFFAAMRKHLFDGSSAS